MIDLVSVTFNKSTNNFNMPFAVIAPKKKMTSGKKEKNLRFNLNNDDPYSNVIGVQQQAVFTQDNILNFEKELDEFADFAIEKVRRERLKKEGYEAEVKPVVGSSMIKRKAKKEMKEENDEPRERYEIDRIEREKVQLEREKKNY